MNAAQLDLCLKNVESLLKFGHELQQHIEREDEDIHDIRDSATETKEILVKESVNIEKAIEGEISSNLCSK